MLRSLRGDNGDRQSRERVSSSIPLAPALSNLLRNQLNCVFFYGAARRICPAVTITGYGSCGDTMIDAVAIKSPNRRWDCPSVHFKIPLTKGISSYWYQHRRFGYISLVTFGSRWTPSTRRCQQLPEGRRTEQMRTIGNRTSGSVQ